MSVTDWLEVVRRCAVKAVVSRASSQLGRKTRQARVGRGVNAHNVAETLEQRLVLSAPPLVASISRSAPTTPITNLSSVSYSVTFTESVTGVAASDFRVITNGPLAASATVALAGSGANYTATVNGIHGNGSVQLELVDDDTITDAASIPLGGAGFSNGSFVGQSYTEVQAGPLVVSINRTTPAGPVLPAGTTSATYTVTFTKAVTGVVASDFHFYYTGYPNYLTSTGLTVAQTSGSVYTVTVNGISGAGGFGLNVVDDGAIRDLAGNPLQETTTSGSPLFSTQRTYAASTNPLYVAVADLNGDTKSDIVVANLDSTVGVYISNGDGTFQAQKTYALGGNAAGLSAPADVNGDGKTDLVLITNGFAGILFGNGDGTFQPEMTYAVPAYDSSVAAADVNADGKPDLVIANSSVNVLLNNGDGTFQAVKTYGTGQGSSTAVVADINGDGKPDIITPNSSVNTVSLLLGNGDGTFQAQQTVSVGARPSAVVIADLSGDGIPDLISLNSVGTSISVLLGNGNGTFQAAKTFASGANPVSISASDVNGDGLLDVVIGNQSSVYFSTLLGNGDGTFQALQTYYLATSTQTLAVGDVNGDGRTDVVTIAPSKVNLSPNTGTGSFAGQTYTTAAASLVIIRQPTSQKAGANIGPVQVNVDSAPGLVTPADTSTVTLTLSSGTFVGGSNSVSMAAVNGVANFSTLAVTGAGTGYVLTASDGALTPATSTPFNISAATPNLATSLVTVSPAILDVGTTATVTLNAGSDAYNNLETGQGVVFYLSGSGTSTGTFSQVIDNHDGTYKATFTATSAGTARSIAARINGGAVTSAQPTVTVTPLAYVVSINRTSPVGPTTTASSVTYTVTFSQGVAGVTAAAFTTVTTGTMASTGLAVTPVSTSVYTVTVSGISGYGTIGLNFVDHATVKDLMGLPLQSKTSSSFQPRQTFAAGAGNAGPSGLAMADLNHDGKLDLVTGNQNGTNISVLLGNGDGTFLPQQTYLVGTNPGRVVVADVNSDGLPDLIVSNNGSGSISILLGNGDGTFQTPSSFAVGPNPTEIAVVDVDGDGKPDLVVVNSTSNSLGVYLGNGDGTFRAPGTYSLPNQCYTLAVVDVNADGRPDLVTESSSNSTVNVLLGNGDGTFASQVAYSDRNAQSGLVTGDFNADGKIDLATNNFNGLVSVLPGTGTGAFQAPATFATYGQYPANVATGDLNGDGKPDLISMNGSDNNVSVFLGNGDGTLQSQISYAAGTNPSFGVVADVNSDGRPDLIVADSDGANVSVLLGTGFDNFTGQTYSTPATKLAFGQQPVNGQAGVTLAPISVNIQDTSGSTVTSDTSTVTLTLNGGTFSTGLATASVAAVNGVATFSTLTINATGNYNITASDGALANATSLNFSVNPGLISLSQSSVSLSFSNIDVGMTSTVTVQAKDSFGNNITSGGQGIAFSLGSSGTSGGTIGAVVDHRAGTYTAKLIATSAGTARAIVATINGSTVTAPQPSFTVVALASVVSINRSNPAGQSTAASTVVYTVTFSQTVTGVDASDFAVAATGGAIYGNLAVASVSGSVYTVTISGISGPGTLGLNLVDNGSIRDANGFPLQSITPASSSFQAQRTLSAGAYPFTTLMADLNGDGNADLIVPNAGASFVSVLLGNGESTFQAARTFTVVAQPDSVISSDLNSDGIPDLLAFDSSGGVSVLLGNGDGTFQTQKSFIVIPGDARGAVADVNGDGKPDLVAFSTFGTTVRVYPGNGDGTFGAYTSYNVGSAPYSVAIGDVNRDGKQDIVVANNNSRSMGVLLGNGNATFQTQKTYTTGNGPYSVGLTDLNGDGKLDAVTANSSDNNVSVFLGVGDGTFQTQKTYAVGTGPQSIALADLNGDGKPDLVVANTGSVGILLGNGDGTLQAQATFADNATNTYLASVADINGDARLDLIVNNEYVPSVGFMLDQGNDNFTGQTYSLQAGAPVITGFTVSPNSVTVGSTITLSATGVSDPNTGGSITNVSFYRESNGTAGLQTGTGGDTLVGTVTTGSGGTYTLANVSTTGLAPGAYTYYAVATDNYAAGSVPSSAVETLNPASPTISSLAVTPNPVISGATVTLNASGVADSNTGGTITNVAFYRESNGTAGLQTGTGGDTLLGSASSGTGGVWTLANVSTTGLAPGSYGYYAVATDNYSAVSAVSSTLGTISPAAPIIGNFGGIPSAVAVGATFTLSATGVTDPNPGGSIASVTFYRESNGTAGLQAGTGGDTLVGAATNTSAGVWSLANVSTAGLAAGNYTYYAVATDTYSTSSAVASTTEAVQAVGITVGSVFIGRSATGVVTGYFDLTFNVPSAVNDSLSGYQAEADLSPGNSSVTLTGAAIAPNAVFPGQTPSVAATGNVLQVTDSLSGASQANPITNGAGLFRVLFSVAAGAAGGTFQVTLSQVYLADPQGNALPLGTIVPGTITVVSPTPPTIGALSAAPNPVISGNTLTLTASGVTDPNPGGAVSSVAFYRESNATAGLQIGADTLLGTSTTSAGGTWSLANIATAGLAPGAYTYYAVATDNYSATSAAASAASTINPASPTIGGLAGSPNPIAAGSSFSLSATSVTDPNPGGVISSVAFYRESNGTAGLQSGTGGDTFVGAVSSSTGGAWTLPNVSTAGLATGAYTYYAVATDSYSAVSAIASTTESVQAISITIGSVTINSNSKNVETGYFDLTFNVPAGVSPNLSGYQVQVNVAPPNLGVTLTGAAAAPNPVFPGQTPTVLQSGNVLQVTDSLSQAGQSNVITNGAGLFRVQFSVAAGTSSGAFQISLSQALLSDAQGNSITLGTATPGTVTVVQVKVPEVTGVAFSSSAWNASFPNVGGYPVPAGASQLNDLPWINLNTLAITFSEGVNVTQNSLRIAGVNVPTYTASGFSYNAGTFTATWTYATAFGADKLLLSLASTGANAITDLSGTALDGEWTNSTGAFPSGDGFAGGDFNFNVNILPGDVDNNGTVNIFDTISTRNRQFNSPGSANYSVFYDVDGSAGINIFDTINVRNRQFTALPDGSPFLPPTGGQSRIASGGNTNTLKPISVTLPQPASVPTSGTKKQPPTHPIKTVASVILEGKTSNAKTVVPVGPLSLRAGSVNDQRIAAIDR